jgi:hypothetical protein
VDLPSRLCTSWTMVQRQRRFVELAPWQKKVKVANFCIVTALAYYLLFWANINPHPDKPSILTPVCVLFLFVYSPLKIKLICILLVTAVASTSVWSGSRELKTTDCYILLFYSSARSSHPFHSTTTTLLHYYITTLLHYYYQIKIRKCSFTFMYKEFFQ